MTQVTNDWHLNKGFSLSLIFTIIMQVVVIVFFFANMANRINNIEEWKTETVENRFTKSDGRLVEKDIKSNTRDVNRIYVKLDELQKDLTLIKVALGVVEPQFGG